MPDRDRFRFHARASARLSAVLSRTASGEQVAVRIVDVGLGGFGLVSPVSIAVGEAVVVLVSAPLRWEPLSLTGTVAWVAPHAGAFRAGIKLTHGHAADVRAAGELVASGDAG